MLTSVIISIYKDVKALKAILDALQVQTTLEFEIIVSEDGESQEVKEFLKSYSCKIPLIHSTQEDKGFRKNRALNSALRKSTGDYLIFIDGDCVPHPRFVEQHQLLSEKDKYLAGRRVMVGPKFSERFYGDFDIKAFSSSFLRKVLPLTLDKTTFFEEGIFIKSEKINNFLMKNHPPKWLLGCNFSCYKQALLDINGFDEDYENPAHGEDTDIEWRLQKAGYSLKSVRHRAIVYHLDHKESQHGLCADMFNKKKEIGRVKCSHGIEQL